MNPIDDSITVTALLEADSGKSSRGETVYFVARCKSNKTEVYINWQDYLGDDSSSVYEKWKHVTVRIGNLESEQQKWSISTDNNATFAPTWAGDLLKKMSEHQRLIVQTTPYNENPVTALFDTSGMAARLAPLAETCGWSFD